MEVRDFEKTAVRTQTGGEIIFDARPYGDQQGAAVDSCLRDRLGVIQNTGIGRTSKLIVLLCDSSAAIPATAQTWLAGLAAIGAPAEIRRV